MFPTLQLGPLALPTGPFTLLLGVWLGLWLAEREADRLELNRDHVSALAMTGLLAGLVGARLGYALAHLDAYLVDPLGLISNNLATFSLPAGLLIGVGAAWLYGRRQRLPLRVTLDALAPALGALSGALALSQLASGDGFGAPARLPWSLYLWDEWRHPTQVYALLAALLVFGAWWRWGQSAFAGFGFLLVVAGTAAATVFIEAYRGDSALLAGGWRTAQVLGLLVLGASLILIKRWHDAQPPTDGPRVDR